MRGVSQRAPSNWAFGIAIKHELGILVVFPRTLMHKLPKTTNPMQKVEALTKYKADFGIGLG